MTRLYHQFLEFLAEGIKENDISGHEMFHNAVKEKQKLEKEYDKLSQQRRSDDLFNRLNSIQSQIKIHRATMKKHYYDRKDDTYLSKNIHNSVSSKPLRQWRDDWISSLLNDHTTSSSDRKKLNQEFLYRDFD